MIQSPPDHTSELTSWLVSPTLAVLLGRVLGLDRHLLLAVVALAALPTAQNVLVYATQ